MSFLFAPSKRKPIPEFTGLQVQTAVNILPIPILYGTPRVPMNIIYVNGFRAVAIESGGGKGLLTGGKSETQGYKYFATLIGALGEGPIERIWVVFDNQSTYTPQTAPDGKIFDLFEGDVGQLPWSVIASSWPNDEFSYPFVSYVGFYDWPLDSSATMSQLNFVVDGSFSGTCPLNEYTAPDGTKVMMDADPALCIWDLLVNERYGVPFPEDFLDLNSLFTSPAGLDPDQGDSALSTYCQAVGFGFSTVLNNYEPASSILDRWCKNLVVAPVWTGSKLKFIPYWDRFNGDNPGFNALALGAQLKYYNPSTILQPLFDLDDNSFIQADLGDDPITLSRVDIVDVKNIVRVDFRDRYLLYNDSVAEAKDENMVETYSPRVERMGLADEFTHNNYANISAHTQLKRNIAVRNTFTWRLGWQFCILEPMDVVTLTDSVLGLNQYPVRIISIEEDEKGILTFQAEEFQPGAQSTIQYPSAVSEPPTFLQTNEAAPPVHEPVILEPTPELLTARGQSIPTIIVGAAGGTGGVSDPNWGGANVFVSSDNVTYLLQGVLHQPSRVGGLTAPLPAYAGLPGSNPDNTNILQVSLIESNGLLESVTTSQAQMYVTICAIVDANGVEFLAYTTATLTGQNAYDLTGLYRGLYGTEACLHSADAKFLRLDTLVFEGPLPPEFIGAPLWLKLQSFNLWGQGLQELSTCVAYPYTPNGVGSGLGTNPIVTAIESGLCDLETVEGVLDLNIGGAGECGISELDLDLETI